MARPQPSAWLGGQTALRPDAVAETKAAFPREPSLPAFWYLPRHPQSQEHPSLPSPSVPTGGCRAPLLPVPGTPLPTGRVAGCPRPWVPPWVCSQPPGTRCAQLPPQGCGAGGQRLRCTLRDRCRLRASSGARLTARSRPAPPRPLLRCLAPSIALMGTPRLRRAECLLGGFR